MTTDVILQWVTLIGAAVGVVISVVNARNMKKKMDVDNDVSSVKNAKDIQEMYERAFEEFEARWTKRLEEQEKDCEKHINGLRHSLEDQARQKQGELLVMVEDLTQRNQDLKIQVAELGGIVQGATGLKIHQWGKKEGS